MALSTYPLRAAVTVAVGLTVISIIVFVAAILGETFLEEANGYDRRRSQH